MNEILSYILSLTAGFFLGYIFFGGLWLTVRRLPQMKKPFLWTILSFFLRLGIALAGFYFIVRGGHWVRLLICLVGFISVRYILAAPMHRQVDSANKEDTE
jgi:F1F0 ATPase subunit 2